MKKLIIYSLVLILFSANIYSQEQTSGHNNTEKELNLETNTGKFVQGAFIGAFTTLTVKEFTRDIDERDKWIAIPISIVVSFLYESAFNKNTNTEKKLFTVAGAVSVSFTFELFNKHRRY